jgi:uncharacterized membrane protein
VNVVQTAKEHVKQLVDKVAEKEPVKQLVDKVAEKVVDGAVADSRLQAVTIAASREDVRTLFQDANRLSEIFGDVADVTSTGPDRLRWKFTLEGSDGPEWECVTVAEDDARLRFVDAKAGEDAGIVLDFRDAPQGRGTEVIARVSSPAPGALTGALAFKALYRARALIMTGEVPTIKHNPGARASER